MPINCSTTEKHINYKLPIQTFNCTNPMPGCTKVSRSQYIPDLKYNSKKKRYVLTPNSSRKHFITTYTTNIHEFHTQKTAGK